MGRNVGEVRLFVTDEGKMFTEGLSNTGSSSFMQFANTADPAYMRERHNRSNPNHSRQYSQVQQKALKGRFSVYKRKQKYHFGFGFYENSEWTLAELIEGSKHILKGTPAENLDVEGKLAYIKQFNPDIYEADPNENGERVFCRPRSRNDKANWEWDFGNNNVIVLKARKEKA